MAMNIDWTTAICGAVVGYYAKGKVEDVKSSAKKAVSDTAAAAAIAAAQAVNGQRFDFDEAEAAQQRIDQINQKIDQQLAGQNG